MLFILNGARHTYSHTLVMNDIDKILSDNNLDDLISVLEDRGEAGISL